jgi:hypothetical protein
MARIRSDARAISKLNRVWWKSVSMQGLQSFSATAPRRGILALKTTCAIRELLGILLIDIGNVNTAKNLIKQ